MKLYAPKYYKKFKCIADKCRHSCCVGWEIGVDGETLSRYGSLPICEREEILSRIDDGVIRLSEDGRCPFLDCHGLCKIISRHGEAFISEICREHPRFYNFSGGRAEVGIGASCEEAARIILSSEDYCEMIEIGERDGECDTDFELLSEREYIYSVLKTDGLSYCEKLDRIKKRYYIDNRLFTFKSINEKLSCLEYLREEDKSLFTNALVDREERGDLFCERFFAYLIYRHLSSSVSFENMRARLCVCLLLVRLFESLVYGGEDRVNAARLISEEIEYSEDNIDSLILDFECEL